MSKPLYYGDAYTTRFTARVVERFTHQGKPAIVLEQTYFYPTSGGQPADRGQLDNQEVLDVFIRPEDGAIVHLLRGEVQGEEVQGEIDWERRFDHMQQHTGQHILSQAFIQVAAAETVGFHLSENSVTIDLDCADLASDRVDQAESLANQIVWADRPVRIRFVDEEEAARLPLRKLPERSGKQLRLIEIDGFDLNACGGTHVARTGAVGVIKIIGLERRGEQLRVEFLCGQRALLDYRLKQEILQRLALTFTTGYDKLEAAVDAIREEATNSRRLVKRQQEALLQHEARELLAGARPLGAARLIAAAFEGRDPRELRLLASTLVEQPGVIVLFGNAAKKAQLLFARAQDAPGQMDQLLRQTLQQFESGAGGGTPSFAQGGGPEADRQRMQQAIAQAEEQLRAELQ